MSTLIEEARTRILGGGAGAGVLSSLQARVAELRAGHSSPAGILGGPLATEIREKGVLATARERIQKVTAPPAAPSPPAPPAAEAKRGKVSIESIEGVYARRPPPYAGPLSYEALSESTKEWLTPEMWAGLSPEQKQTALEGAGVGYEALKTFLLRGGAEVPGFVTPGKFQSRRIAISM